MERLRQVVGFFDKRGYAASIREKPGYALEVHRSNEHPGLFELRFLLRHSAEMRRGIVRDFIAEIRPDSGYGLLGNETVRGYDSQHGRQIEEHGLKQVSVFWRSSGTREEKVFAKLLFEHVQKLQYRDYTLQEILARLRDAS